MKMSILASLLLVGASAGQTVEPLKTDLRAIVRVSCGRVMGTAWKINEDTYVTADHVISEGGCSVGGEPISDVRVDPDKDFATFIGPKTPYRVKYSCGGFNAKEEYLAVGYAFGFFHKTFQPWIASVFKQGGYQSFIGESIPGMSGGPVLNEWGKAVGIVNMRWPARSRELKDTFICKD